MDELEQLKQDLAKATEKLKQFEGIDPDQVTRDRTSLSDQLANTQRQFNEFKASTETDRTKLQQELQAKDTGYHFRDQLASAGVLPEYRDRFNDVAGALKFEGDKLLTADNQPFDAGSLRTKYPAMFAPIGDAAGSGATGSNSSATSNQPTVFNPQNGMITGVDPQSIINGSVVVK